MADLNILREFEDLLSSTADIANSLKRKMGLFALVGLVASASLAWLLYSPDSSLTWNFFKCALVLLPAIVICFVWHTLGNVVDAPNQLSDLADEEGLLNDLKTLKLQKPKSFRGLVSTIRTIRNDEHLGSVIETVGGIALLVNPFFLLFSFINIAILLVLIIIVPFILVF